MKALMARFRELCSKDLDISEHLGLLRGLACSDAVKAIVEIGFRGGVSATALASVGKSLTCYDIEPCTASRDILYKLAPNFLFVQGNSLDVTIPMCDLLHIDSLHTYTHLLAELSRHHARCRRWIALHDTETFGTSGKDGSSPGLTAAIEKFLQENQEWKIQLHLRNNNGMTLLQRQSTPESSTPR